MHLPSSHLSSLLLLLLLAAAAAAFVTVTILLPVCPLLPTNPPHQSIQPTAGDGALRLLEEILRSEGSFLGEQLTLRQFNPAIYALVRYERSAHTHPHTHDPRRTHGTHARRSAGRKI